MIIDHQHQHQHQEGYHDDDDHPDKEQHLGQEAFSEGLVVDLHCLMASSTAFFFVSNANIYV